MSFAKNIGNKYGKKLFDKSMDVSKKYGKKYGNKLLDNSISAAKDFAKIAGKKILTKSAESTGDLIGNKIADRITKSNRNKAQKEDNRKMEETQEILIPPEKENKQLEILNYSNYTCKALVSATHIKWNTIKSITHYVLKNSVKVKIYLNLLLDNMLKLIVYLTRIMKLNQLDLKHLC